MGTADNPNIYNANDPDKPKAEVQHTAGDIHDATDRITPPHMAETGRHHGIRREDAMNAEAFGWPSKPAPPWAKKADLTGQEPPNESDESAPRITPSPNPQVHMNQDRLQTTQTTAEPAPGQSHSPRQAEAHQGADTMHEHMGHETVAGGKKGEEAHGHARMETRREVEEKKKK